MWRAQAGRSVSVTNDSDSDDWDTNPDYENEIDDKGIVDITAISQKIRNTCLGSVENAPLVRK